MTMKRDKCKYCGTHGAEALYAVDGKVEWFCSYCLAEWTTELEELDGADIITLQTEWGYNNLGEEVDH